MTQEGCVRGVSIHASGSTHARGHQVAHQGGDRKALEPTLTRLKALPPGRRLPREFTPGLGMPGPVWADLETQTPRHLPELLEEDVAGTVPDHLPCLSCILAQLTSLIWNF